ncbi:MAG: bifunctional methylenetetrahydrofolate dehydrogenase/methenyltetrahydrofolate cyclohydrolase FolD [bacterium]
MARIIEGKRISEEIYRELEAEIAPHRGRIGLAVILVGDDPASATYVRNKEKACKRLGIDFTLVRFPESATKEEVLKSILQLNEDNRISGIIVQLPLPEHMDEIEITRSVLPIKDVDGLHPENLGNLLSGKPTIVPCTPLGIVELIRRENIEVRGKKAVIVGRSNLVGKPLFHLLLSMDATVTVCHSKTKDLKEETSQADILVVAVGVPRLIKKDMVKPGAVVIDVGINKVENKLVGDVDFEEVEEIASYITPVPGGVGLMTVAMLMSNVLKAYKMRNNL